MCFFNVYLNLSFMSFRIELCCVFLLKCFCCPLNNNEGPCEDEYDTFTGLLIYLYLHKIFAGDGDSHCPFLFTDWTLARCPPIRITAITSPLWQLQTLQTCRASNTRVQLASHWLGLSYRSEAIRSEAARQEAIKITRGMWPMMAVPHALAQEWQN